uniref:Alginate export domain-containing protein n=1 Tax=Candidatus Kentrum eta TaxID=2126337 RepID=A0A450UAK6_9GAMM|nr:MAG: hypothetical protein BECKH772A_GA0070896_1000329 [Candidatus Kentron sp. H]VFJ89070.1 MAG: hypothetical protein BECKH772B_GA0070898_1000329 [Candidatus Kentron sp. H]VFJ95760.1 MAG: hypothetical protein BECKH772C_GA0070978_1000329 [Candidatus Kentron sp. H]
MRNKITPVLALVIASVATQAGAIETRLSGHIESQLRWFQSSPTLSQTSQRQVTGVNPSFAIQPEWRYQTADRRHDFSIIPFARYDEGNDERTHVDMRELYWLYHGEGWEVLAGIDQVFWGVAESRHLVDIINQKDLVEDPDEEDKLGQPMVRLTLDLKPTLALMGVLDPEEAEKGPNWGKLSLFLMPGFRERTFPGPEGRLRSPLPVDEDAAVYSDDASRDRVDLALRYSHTLDRWNFGVSYFHGNGREPRLLPNQTYTNMVPHYDLINQVGLDLQYTGDVWLGKFEGIIREGQGDTFGALVAGFEYTKYQVFDSNADLGFLMEYLYDDRDDDGLSAPVTPFDNDLFLGTRLSLNDVKNTQLLAGVMTDLETDEYSFNIEAQRRITNNISAELLVRLFGGDESGGAFSSIEEDDYLQLSVFYHF